MGFALLFVRQAAMGQANQRAAGLVFEIDLDQARSRRHFLAALPAEFVSEPMDWNDLGELSTGYVLSPDIDEIEATRMGVRRDVGTEPAHDLFRIDEKGENGRRRCCNLDLAAKHQGFGHREASFNRAERQSFPSWADNGKARHLALAQRHRSCMIASMQLPSALQWLVDEAGSAPDAGQFLTALATRLIDDGLPLAGATLTLAAPHPIIARRTWLWRADTGAVIEALGFGDEHGNVGRDWLVGLGAEIVQAEQPDSPIADSPFLRWAVARKLGPDETAFLNQVARFAAAPLTALVTRTTLATLLETYLGRRSAAQVLSGRLQRKTGETIRAVLLYGDLRGFTELSEAASASEVVAALDAWFDRIAGAVHAFGGEVLKFIGDGVLAIFPVGENPPSVACDATFRAVAAAKAGMLRLNQDREKQGLPPLAFGMALHLGDMLWGNIGTADRLDFTAIGPAVNLVGRLEGLCKPLGHSVLVSGSVAAQTTATLIPLGEHMLRGIAQPCAVFALPED